MFFPKICILSNPASSSVFWWIVFCEAESQTESQRETFNGESEPPVDLPVCV